MSGRPQPNEAASYYATYIDRVAGDDVIGELARQMETATAFLSRISEEQSQHRYAPDKWSRRELLAHVTDTERVFTYRALWFARGFSEPLASYDQNIAVAAAGSDGIAWADHVAEFRAVRSATLHLFRNLPEEAWSRSGIASDNPVSVRALAYITAGHSAHHFAILRERYLS
jgi:hypothetical protein